MVTKDEFDSIIRKAATPFSPNAQSTQVPLAPIPKKVILGDKFLEKIGDRHNIHATKRVKYSTVTDRLFDEGFQKAGDMIQEEIDELEKQAKLNEVRRIAHKEAYSKLPKGIAWAAWHDIPLPQPDKKYNPVLWKFIIEKITNGGKGNYVDDEYRRAFEPFARAISETKAFLINKPIRIASNTTEKKHLDMLNVILDGNPTKELWLSTEDVENAEPPFEAMWIESFGEDSRIFDFDEGQKDASVRQIGYWSIRLGFQKSTNMSVVERDGGFHAAIFDSNPHYSRSNQMIWASIEPFMRSGWHKEDKVFYDDARKRIHKRYQKYIGNTNRIAVINCDRELSPQAVIRSGMRKYGFHWEVRGYYRNLHNPETMGLNANGERIVKGKTWVKPHTKGDKEKPKIEKRWKVKI
jgi:hypothetical protein